MEPVLCIERAFWSEVRVADIDEEEGEVWAEGETAG